MMSRFGMQCCTAHCKSFKKVHCMTSMPHAASYPAQLTLLVSFAYDTVKERIPTILTKVIDVFHKQISDSFKRHGEDGRLDNIAVISKLSQLRSEIMTDKALLPLQDSFIDQEFWNQHLKNYKEKNGKNPSFFEASWLYVECYVYRKIASIINNSKYMKNFDPFMGQKQKALEQSIPAISTLSVHLQNILNSTNSGDVNLTKQHFFDLLQISLWGNKCDLSISGGADNAQVSVDLHKNLESFRYALLVDDSNRVWDKLQRVNKKKKIRIDIVLDNSGFELFTDFVLADFLLSSKLCDLVVFHPKPMPWFVSDVTSVDFYFTLDYLSSCSPAVAELSKKWTMMLNNKQMIFVDDKELLKFWCLPFPFCEMANVSRELYDFLSKSDLVFFKGDLNYRKLVGDLDWPHETEFKYSLRGFTPTSICSLRTLKANVVVGLKAGVAERLYDEDQDWMVTGKYAVIQFS